MTPQLNEETSSAKPSIGTKSVSSKFKRLSNTAFLTYIGANTIPQGNIWATLIATDIPDPAANTQHASNLFLDNTTFKFWCMMLARLTALALPASGHEVVWVTGSLLRSKHLTLVQIQGKDNKKNEAYGRWSNFVLWNHKNVGICLFLVGSLIQLSWIISPTKLYESM